MNRTQNDFNIQEAGCLLYIADKNLGGIPFGDLHKSNWKDLTLQNSIMMMDLYQDDGFSVRVVQGELNDEEKSQWISKVSWKVNFESGEMVVSGVCDEDLGDYLEDFGDGVNEPDCHLGCVLKIPSGVFQVDVYSFPPNDLAGGLLILENRREFHQHFGDVAKFEKMIEYFQRTHPNKTPPEWLKNGWEDANFLDFVIHLSPLSNTDFEQELQNDGCLKWNFRKPEICPVGIRLEEN